MLVDDGRVFSRSDAALRIAARLSFPWRLASLLLVFPRFLREPDYDAVARHRYRLVRPARCLRPPDPGSLARFLDDGV